MALPTTLFMPGHEHRLLAQSIFELGGRIIRAFFPKSSIIVDILSTVGKVTSVVDDAHFTSMVSAHKRALESRRITAINDIDRGRIDRKIAILDQWLQEQSWTSGT